MQLILLSSGAVTTRSAVPALAASALLPEKLALSVRPLGSTAVIVIVQAAVPGAEVGTGVQVPLFVKMSLTIGELTVIGASTLGLMGMTMSSAVSVTVATVDSPTGIDGGARVTVSEVVSGTTLSVPLTIVMA